MEGEGHSLGGGVKVGEGVVKVEGGGVRGSFKSGVRRGKRGGMKE